MMKNDFIYTAPEVELIVFNNEDVITTSGPDGGLNMGGDGIGGSESIGDMFN